MDLPNTLIATFGGLAGTVWGLNWLAIYLFFAYAFLIIDLALVVACIILFRIGLSYRIKVDLHALPPTVADLLKRAGVRERYHDRWMKVREDAKATPPASYATAILSADALVDELLQELGFVGHDVAERFGRLNNLGLKQTIVNGIFRAHKMRNQIAHTPNFPITEKEGERTLDLYETFLREIKLLA